MSIILVSGIIGLMLMVFFYFSLIKSIFGFCVLETKNVKVGYLL